MRPEQFADYLALVGDPVDDIPGVPGVGAKTAAALLGAHDDLEALAKGLGAVAGLPIRGAAGVAGRLQENWAQVLLARQLTVLEDRVPGIEELPVFELRADALKEVADYLQVLGIGGPLLRRCRDLSAKAA